MKDPVCFALAFPYTQSLPVPKHKPHQALYVTKPLIYCVLKSFVTLLYQGDMSRHSGGCKGDDACVQTNNCKCYWHNRWHESNQ